MGLDRAYRNVKLFGNLLVGVTEREEMKRIAFPLGERDEGGDMSSMTSRAPRFGSTYRSPAATRRIAQINSLSGEHFGTKPRAPAAIAWRTDLG
jgi:hypothetical protein